MFGGSCAIATGARAADRTSHLDIGGTCCRQLIRGLYFRAHQVSRQFHTMIREGRAAGWFALAPDAYLSWASLNGVELSHVAPGVVAGRGGALVASETLRPESSITPLMTVPRELILSLERVKEHSKTDRDYREVLESLSEFGTVGLAALSLRSQHKTINGDILIFRFHTCIATDADSDSPWRNTFILARSSIHHLP